MYSANILPGVADPLPPGIFLVPLWTDAESVEIMLRVLSQAYASGEDVRVIKDFLNALQDVTEANAP